jgi:phasin family protein
VASVSDNQTDKVATPIVVEPAPAVQPVVAPIVKNETPAASPAAPAAKPVAAVAKTAAPVAKAVKPATKATKPIAKTAKSVPAIKAVTPVPPKKSVIVNKPVAAEKAAAPTKGFKTMTDTVKKVEDAAKTFTAETGEKVTEMFKDVTARAKTAMEKSGEMVKDVTEFSKDNLEAVVESGKIAAKGMQTAAQTAADFGRKNFEATTAMLKSAAAVKSPTEFMKVQSDFAKSQFEAAVAEMSKSSEFTLKLMGEAFQPISNRYSVAAEAVKSRLAA